MRTRFQRLLAGIQRRRQLAAAFVVVLVLLALGGRIVWIIAYGPGGVVVSPPSGSPDTEFHIAVERVNWSNGTPPLLGVFVSGSTPRGWVQVGTITLNDDGTYSGVARLPRYTPGEYLVHVGQGTDPSLTVGSGKLTITR